MKISKKTFLCIIVLTIILTTYVYSLKPLIGKIANADQADAILQIITTIIGGILSGIVAYAIASIEIKNYKNEQLIEKKELENLETKINIERLKRLLVEVEDNHVTCQGINLSPENLQNGILVIKMSVSDFFWRLNSNLITVDDDLLIELNIYYKNIFILQTVGMEYINVEVINSFIKKQEEVKAFLSREINNKQTVLQSLIDEI